MVTWRIILQANLIAMTLWICGGKEYTNCGQKQTGIISSRVVAGSDTDSRAWPWQALVTRNKRYLVSMVKSSEIFGGGSVISDNWILTAAHLFDRSEFASAIKTENWRGIIVILGLSKYPTMKEKLSSDIFTFEPGHVIIHKEYDQNTYDFDIALIKFGTALSVAGNRFVRNLPLIKKIPFGKTVQPVCLPCLNSCGKADADSFIESKCKKYAKLVKPQEMTQDADAFITGFGSTIARDPLVRKFKYSEKLQEAKLVILNDTSCENGIKHINKIYKSVDHNVIALYTERMLCALGSEEKEISDACQGDSGGPLVKEISGNGTTCWTLIGIVSWGLGCASTTQKGRILPGFYTNVPALMHWVIDHTQERKLTALREPAKSCGKPISATNGYLEENDGKRMIGSIITHFCNEGYLLKGKSTAACLPTREWQPPPACEPVKCSSPRKPINGKVRGTNRTFKAKVIYICNPGYELHGLKIATCNEAGRWSGRERKCKRAAAVKCSSPKRPINGRVLGKNFSFQAQVRFVCNIGYVLHGTKFSNCNKAGKWTGSERKCKRKPMLTRQHIPTCGEPILLANGYLEKGLNEDQMNESVVIYFCNDGYFMKGNNAVRCLSTGEWESPPQCEPHAKCSELQLSDRIVVIGTERNVGSTVWFECMDGFVNTGQSLSTCMPNQRWNGLPECVDKPGCPDIEAPQNGNLVGNETKIGSTVRFICNDGYRLIGNDITTCSPNAEWDEIPKCTPILCSAPTRPENGYVIVDGLSIGSRAGFYCSDGYTLEGRNFAICSEIGRWNEIPDCKENPECPEIETPQNGKVVRNGRKIGRTARFICNDGYKLIGNEISTCHANAEWDEIPKCTVVLCSAPRQPDNGHVIVDGFSVGSRADFYCSDGYTLEGRNFAICSETGKWDEIPDCKDKPECPEIKTPQNGKVVRNERKIGSTARFDCNDGYKLIGNKISTCHANAEWDEIPKCTAVLCSAPRQPDNGRVIFDGFSVGSRAEFSCSGGYKLEGSSFSICSERGEWEEVPNCKAEMCSVPSPLVNGHASFNDLSIGSGVVFRCNEGYTLEGREVALCNSDGTWTLTPKCIEQEIFVASTCSPPEVSWYGFISNPKESYSLQELILFECDEGYKMEGQSWTYCLGSNKYSSKLPTCIPERTSCLASCIKLEGAPCQCHPDCETDGGCCSDYYLFCAVYFLPGFEVGAG